MVQGFFRVLIFGSIRSSLSLEIRITPPGYLPTYAVTLRGRRKKGRERGKEKSASLFPYPLNLSTPATQAKSWSKNTTVFVSSSDMFLDKKTLLEIGVILG